VALRAVPWCPLQSGRLSGRLYRTAKTIAFADGAIDSVHMFGFFLRSVFLAMLLASTWFPNRALAQSTNLHVDVVQHRESTDSELGHAQWKRTRARVGVAFSVLGISLGVGLLAPGIIWNICQPEGDLDCAGHPSAATPLIATGSVVIAAGLAGLGVSAHGLRVAKRELREIARRPPATTLRFGPTGVTLHHRF
jgi:hypothetical protein